MVLALRDIKVKYRNSILGYFWAVVPQLATVALFTMLAQRRVFNMGQTDLPYVIHALWSLSLWQLFSSVLLNSQRSLKNSGRLITKVNFSQISLPIASIVPSLLDFMIRLVPVIGFCIWYNIPVSWHVLMLPLLIIVIIMMALGIGLMLSCINLVFNDLGTLVGILMTFGMFLAPILYPPPTHGLFSLINVINPFSPLLIGTQQLLIGALPDNLLSLTISIALAIVVFRFGWHFFHVALPRVIERA